jgi:hypothetical protein
METTTTTVVLQSPDVSITKTEIFDVDFARQLADDKNIPKEEREKIRRYVKNRVRGNQHETTYKLGRYCKHEFLGRFCALRGESLQCLGKDIRNALGCQFYWDLDMVNAQPTLLYQYAERNGWKCDAVKTYIQNREELLNDVCESLVIERWEAKEKVIAMFFGCGAGAIESLPSFFTDDLYPELRMIMKNNWEHNKTVLKWLEKQPNCVGKGLADILQTEERKCLLALDKALSKHGRSMDVFMHDGGLIRKKDNETVFPKSLIHQLEKDIETETGYKMKLMVKEMKTSFVKQCEEDDYAEKKRQFEETGWKGCTYFKLRNPPCFMMVMKDKVEMLSKTDLLQNEEDNKLNDGSSFIKRWLEDPDKKEYNEVVFLPNKTVDDKTFNLFRGFPIEAREGDFSVFTTLLDVLVNHNKEAFDYIEKWLASILQFPFRKTGVAIVVKGKKGVGKDTFFDAVGKLFGKYYFTTGRAEHDLFGKFSSVCNMKLLLKLEEANFQVNKEFEERFKNMITSGKDVMEKKGKDSIEIDSFTNYVLTTNQHVPVMLSHDERRFVIVEASTEKKGDVEFWKSVYQQLETSEVYEAYLHHLLHLDISNFNPAFDRVLTEDYKETLDSFIPYHCRWFQREVERCEQREEDIKEWNGRDLFSSLKSSEYCRFDITETRFGLDLKQYITENIIVKKRVNTGNRYMMDVSKMKDFLIEKGYWVDI